MNETCVRIVKKGTPPDDSEIAQWLGKKAYKYWTQVMQLIDKIYPDVFVPEWLYGGRKHGWSLRYKKSKSFCTLIPEKNRFALLIVFGAEERAKVEIMKSNLSQYTLEKYDKAQTYHDGKWVLFTIDNDKIIGDLMRLLAIKRKPKNN